MVDINTYATWVGVAIRLSDGSIVAYELNSNPEVHIGVQQETDRESFLMGLLTGRPPFGTTSVDIRVRGTLKHGEWGAGAEEARRHQAAEAIEEGPRAIERGSQ